MYPFFHETGTEEGAQKSRGRCRYEQGQSFNLCGLEKMSIIDVETGDVHQAGDDNAGHAYF